MCGAPRSVKGILPSSEPQEASQASSSQPAVSGCVFAFVQHSVWSMALISGALTPHGNSALGRHFLFNSVVLCGISRFTTGDSGALTARILFSFFFFLVFYSAVINT